MNLIKKTARTAGVSYFALAASIGYLTEGLTFFLVLEAFPVMGKFIQIFVLCEISFIFWLLIKGVRDQPQPIGEAV